jgi:cysteine desulfurase
MKRVRGLRDHFWQALRARFTSRVVLNGHSEYCLPNTLNVAFLNHVGADILARLAGVAASTSSACHSGRVELSPVLMAMGVRPNVGMGAIRFSLGRYTTIEEIDAVVDRLTDVLAVESNRGPIGKGGLRRPKQPFG